MEEAKILPTNIGEQVHQRYGADLHDWKLIDSLTGDSQFKIRGIDGFDGTASEIQINEPGTPLRRGFGRGIAIEENGNVARIYYVEEGDEVTTRWVTFNGITVEDGTLLDERVNDMVGRATQQPSLDFFTRR